MNGCWERRSLLTENNHAIYIPSLDAKDLYIADNAAGSDGYSLRMRNGDINLRKYINTLDYSLDQIHLREVYERVYRRMDFSFERGDKHFTNRVINVTFKYAVAEFNKVSRKNPSFPSSRTLYVKLGYSERDLKLEDNVCVKDGELIAIVVDEPVEHPMSDAVLGKYFVFEDGQYKLAKNPRTVKTTAQVREYMYANGFVCDGIRYIRWKRSSGSSRVGKCLFIDEKLYRRMHKWEMCGLKVSEGDEVDLAALESYISLPSSSIVDVVDLDPRHILVIDDHVSIFKDDVVSVEEDDGELVAVERECTIENSIWDGQGLIDPSAMGRYSKKGMILLRNLFFKCCCFNCNLQQFFADHGITEVSQLNGDTQATELSDIKLITTPSSIKYLKFSTLEQWRENVGNMFGVVKYDKPTHFFNGKMVQTHYQLLNTLQMTQEETSEFLKDTFDYLTLLKHNPAVLRNHIKYPLSDEVDISYIASKNDIIYKLLGISAKFTQTKLYYDFRQDLIKSFIKSLRVGHVLVNGNYSTLLGNPIEMLYAAIGQFDGHSMLGVGHIHSTRFEYNQQLIASRSPHVSISNVWLPYNIADAEIDCYFNLTPQIVCINSINENVLQRLAGCDFDSDSILLSDNQHLINAAKKNDGKFKVAVCNVAGLKRKRRYTCEEQADLDIKTSNNLIGDIINLSQELNTQIWDRLNRGASVDDVNAIYLDVCKLSIMSGLEIDKAKKEFTVNNARELHYLREKYKVLDDHHRKIKPNFFAAKDKGKGYYDNAGKNYKKHKTTMDFLQTCVNKYQRSRTARQNASSFIPFSSLIKASRDGTRRQYYKVRRVLSIIEQMESAIRGLYTDQSMTKQERSELVMRERQACIEYIGSISFTPADMTYLLTAIESPEHVRIYRRVFDILFGYPNTSFYAILEDSSDGVYDITPDSYGGISLYGMRYEAIKKNRYFTQESE